MAVCINQQYIKSINHLVLHCFTFNFTGKFTALGITSFGEECGKRGSRGIYVHVKNLLPWILEKVSSHE